MVFDINVLLKNVFKKSCPIKKNYVTLICQNKNINETFQIYWIRMRNNLIVNPRDLKISLKRNEKISVAEEYEKKRCR